MADHVYKPSEVPKGQRWQHFKDYYKIPFIFCVIGIICLVSILRTVVFSTKPDVTIIAATEGYVNYEFWEQTEAAFSVLPLDLNEDGKVLIETEYVQLDQNMMATEPETYMAYQTKLVATLSTAASALQIVDEGMFQYFESEKLIGTYAELSETFGHVPEETVKIPLEELAPYNTIENLPAGLYMTLRPEDAMQIRGDKKKLARYEAQKEVLEALLRQDTE